MTCVHESPAGSRSDLPSMADVSQSDYGPTKANPVPFRCRIFLCLPFLIFCSLALADENIGYYIKVAEDSTSITWQKVWGDNFPEVEDYEITEEDVIVTLGGDGDGDGSCSGIFPDPQLCGNTLSVPQQDVTTSSTSLPPIVVTGTPLELQGVRLAFFFRQIRPTDGSGGFGGSGQGIAKPLDTELCNISSFQNINDETVKRALTSPSTLDGIKDIAEKSGNQNAEFFGRIIRNDRPASDAFSVTWESESDFANVTERTCNRVTLSVSPLVDFSNSILVHTHPECGNSSVGPSQADIDFVRDFGAMGGLIIDLKNDKLIYYDENSTPPMEGGENEGTGDIEDLCGISDN